MSINLTATIDTDEAVKKLQGLEKAAKETTSKVTKDSELMDVAMRKIGSTLASLGVSVSLAAFAKQVATVRGEFQQLEVAFSTMLGSKTEADALMQQAIDLAATTPFDLQGVANGAKQLLAYGSTAKDVAGEIRMLGDIAAGMSLPLGDLVYLYGTTRTQGRLFTRDLMQFTGRGIPLMEELAKQFGVAKSEVSKLVTEGKVGFAEVETALKSMTSEGGKFYNLMAEQSKTITGQISNLEDSITQMFNEIGKKSEGAISTAIGGASKLVDNYETIGREIVGLIGAYGMYKASIVLMNAVLKVKYTLMIADAKAAKIAAAGHATLSKSAIRLNQVLKAMNLTALANPYVLAGVAIAGLTYGIYKLITAKSAEEKAIDRVNKEVEEYNKLQDEAKSKAEGIIANYTSENSTAYDKIEALSKLKAEYPELLRLYDEEALRLMTRIELENAVNGILSDRKILELEQKRDKAQEKFDSLKSQRQTNFVNGKWQVTTQADSATGNALLAEIQAYSKQIEQAKQEREKADFAILSNKDKLDRYTKEVNALNGKIAEYSKEMNFAIDTNQNYMAGVYSDLIKEAETQKATIQKEIDKLNETPTTGNGVDAEQLKQLEQEKKKVREEAYRAEIEAKKAHITDKVELLEYEKKVELDAIDARIKAATDKIIKADLGRLWEATKEKFDARIEQEINNKKTEGIVNSLSFDFRPQATPANGKPKLHDPSEIIKTSADKNLPRIEALFEDFRNKSSKDLLAIADAAEVMLRAFVGNPDEYEAIRNRIDEIRNAAKELQSPLEGVGEAIKGLFTNPVDSTAWAENLSKVKTGLGAITDVAKGLDDVLGALGAGDALDGVVDGLNAAMGALDAAGKGAQIGAVFGPIGSAVGAAVGAIGSLVKSISQIHDKKREKNIQRLQTQIDELERGYDKLGRAVDKAYSTDAGKLIEQQNTMLEQQKRLIEQQMAEEQDKKNTDSEKLAQYQQQLDDIDAQIEDNAAKAAEAYTGISFDSLYDNFLSTLSDMDSSSADFAESFEEYMTNAILGALLAEKYKERLEAFYKNFTDAMSDGQMTDAEKAALKAEYDQITKDALADREALKDVVGTGKGGGQEATSKGFQTMSQETGSELNGRFTDIQGKVTEVRSFVMEILANNKLQYQETVNIRDIMIQLNGNVADIRTYTKVLPAMLDTMAAMNRKLENL